MLRCARDQLQEVLASIACISSIKYRTVLIKMDDWQHELLSLTLDFTGPGGMEERQREGIAAVSQSIGALRFAPWMLKPVNSLLMLSRDEEPHVLLPAEGRG
ncbi:g579 [Coccomyxa viridis]|uniref:G579 protein n=1 Tax=Coccomyxa viridis TaxID=1274662 RepID=A0ABP1FLA1_9CHLO